MGREHVKLNCEHIGCGNSIVVITKKRGEFDILCKGKMLKFHEPKLMVPFTPKQIEVPK